MPTSYIPQKDSLFAVWMANFASIISASYAAYALAAADAAAIASANANFQSAFTAATNAATRTSVAVNAKDIARNQAKQIAREYAAIIQSNIGITADQKAALNLTIRDSHPSPIPAPATSPILTVLGATPQELTIRYADQNTPAKRAKPSGVIAIQIFAVTSSTVVSDPATLPLKATETKNPVGLPFAASDVGKTAYIASRWITRKGLNGPWSNIVTFTVAG